MPKKKSSSRSYLSPSLLLRSEPTFKQYAKKIKNEKPEVRKELYKQYKQLEQQKAKERATQLLSPEYSRYQEQQQIPRRFELKQKIAAGKQNIKRFAAQQRYASSRTGRVGSFLTRAFTAARPSGVQQALYRRSVPITSQNIQQEYPSAPRTLRGSSGGKVGRPRGTYDKRYASVGGVYAYRKLLAAKLRERRLQLQRQANISPQQQMILNRVAASEQAQRQNPEGRIIPSTNGIVPMSNIMGEINSAANIFP